MQIERRAFYNLLRMNWVLDPQLEVEQWQVEDYRKVNFEDLFSRLKSFTINLDKNRFIAMAEPYDTPEEFSDSLLPEAGNDASQQDQIYLLIFELWRRLKAEKPCLSVFCDELDQQIFLYDSDDLEDLEPLQDAVANLQNILEENVDQGHEPIEAWEYISAGCANDIESFLYDFIAEQIDSENYSYAQELLDAFTLYIKDPKWFDFLKARLVAIHDRVTAAEAIRRLAQEAFSEPDLEFNFEMLSFLIDEGEKEIFINLVKQSLLLLDREEDFQELLSICAEYCHQMEEEGQELAIQRLLEERGSRLGDEILHVEDPALNALIKILE